MSQPAEELRLENTKGNKKDKGAKKNPKDKRKETQKTNQKKGTYGLTKAEDKGPHRSLASAEPQEPSGPSSKPHMLQASSSQLRSTMPGASKSATTAKPPNHPTPQAPGASPQADSPIVLPPNATWEEVFQFTLNSSILSGTFEDVKILACSRRSQVLARIGGVRALHANSALLRRALTSAHRLLDTNVLPDVLEDADIRDIDASFQTGHHEYLEDSDFEDGEIVLGPDSEEQSEAEDDTVEETVIDSADTPDANETTNPAPAPASESDSLGRGEGSKGATEALNVETAEDGDETANVTKVGDSTSTQAGGSKDEEQDTGAPPEDAPDAKATGHAQTNGPEVPPPNQSSKASSTKTEGPETSLRSGTRTVLVADIAFQTLRTFIFYAYTGRVAFAPLRSQGLIYQDGGRDASQLPVCSPKSMYRLAAKYGNEPLRMQAITDIRSKLSTQNVLDELFSSFTSRHPEIQDMELSFLLAHITHPDITIRLPWWIDHFAHGHLVDCADTFGKLIHKLACIAAAPPSAGQFGGTKTCPRGCWMPTIRTQSRCDTCGYTMT